MPPPGAPRVLAGFTLVELVTTMILIGILAAVAIPRMSLLHGFDEAGYRDQVVAALEFARKTAVAQRRNVQVTRVGNQLSFAMARDVPEGPAAMTFNRDLILPGGAINFISPRGSTTLAGTTGIVFTPLGNATVTGGNLVVTGDSSVTITVEPGTGHVWHN